MGFPPPDSAPAPTDKTGRTAVVPHSDPCGSHAGCG